mgnify:CR=1 FL=1
MFATVLQYLGTYAAVFASGGALCADCDTHAVRRAYKPARKRADKADRARRVDSAFCERRLLIVRTKLTPARILVIFLIAGIILEAVGVYDYIYKVCQAGGAVPIVGFGKRADGNFNAVLPYLVDFLLRVDSDLLRKPAYCFRVEHNAF